MSTSMFLLVAATAAMAAQTCRYWANDDGCRNGSACQYAHAGHQTRRTGTRGNKYAAYVPHRWIRPEDRKLIVALHGRQQTPAELLRTQGLTRLAEEHGYIVVCPCDDATTDGNGSWYGAGWFSRAGSFSQVDSLAYGMEKGHDGVGRVMDVVKHARDTYSVREDRVFLMGHSMGGAGALYLAMKGTCDQQWQAVAATAPGAEFDRDSVEPFKYPLGYGGDKLKVLVAYSETDGLLRSFFPGARNNLLRCVNQVNTRWNKLKIVDIQGATHDDIFQQSLESIFNFFNQCFKHLK